MTSEMGPSGQESDGTSTTPPSSGPAPKKHVSPAGAIGAIVVFVVFLIPLLALNENTNKWISTHSFLEKQPWIVQNGGGLGLFILIVGGLAAGAIWRESRR
jgi:hypothetical protein